MAADQPTPSSADDEDADPLVGHVLNGKFRVHALVGRGGMGRVYRAEQLPLGRQVALKVLLVKGEIAKLDPAFERRFFLEASLCAKLTHPNIVTVHDYGQIERVGDVGGGYFIAMEYLDGETLSARLRRRRALSLEETLWIAIEIARGLRDAHRNGVIHRDLKPANVMLLPDAEHGERLKILDFGLVKDIDAAHIEELTQEGTFIGSPKYMSPEQISGESVDRRTDLYSLGVIMFRCIVGREPFEAPKSMQILMHHVSKPAPTMRELNPTVDVPESVEAVVAKLLAKNPANRFDDAEALVRELRRVQRDCGFAVTNTTGAFAGAGGEAGARVAPSAVAPSEMPSGPSQLSGARLRPPPASAASDPTTVERPVGLRRRRRRGAVAVLGVIGVAALAGAVYLGVFARSSRRADVVAHAARTAIVPSPTPASSTEPAHAPASPPAAAVATTPTVPASPTSEPTSPAAIRVDPTAAPAADVHHGTHGHSHPSPTPAHPPPAAVAHAPEVPAVQEFGFLSFETHPWSEVTMEGHSLGTTPLVHVRLPVGTHVLRLHNPDANLTTEYPVTIRANETTSRRIGLE